MDFDTAWAMYGPEIGRIALRQRVPGLDPDDVASEMSICLWRACRTFRPGATPFGTYWWSLWLNRRSDIADAHYALKRVHGIPTDTLPERAYDDALFPMPPTKDELGVAVWGALAAGDTPKEVQDDHGLSRRRYYDIIRGWQTPEVRAALLRE
jgi:DNA-directed RNA polymerase specialized sigma24 family protein